MRAICLFASLLQIASAVGFAAEVEPSVIGSGGEWDGIQTDRPGFMDSPGLVRPGVVQEEFGLGYGRSSALRSLSAGEHTLRFGVSRDLELRIGNKGFQFARAGSGWAGGSMGAKLRLAEESRWRPTLSAVPLIHVPLGSACCSGQAWEPALKLAWSKSLPRHLSLGGNWNWSSLQSETGRFAQQASSLSFGWPLGGHLEAFAEAWILNRVKRNGPHLSLYNAGVTRHVGPDVQIDVSAGRSFASRDHEWFVAVGVSVRQRRLGNLARVLHVQPTRAARRRVPRSPSARGPSGVGQGLTDSRGNGT